VTSPATGWLGGFLGAVQFLTRVPVRLRATPVLARSVPWFPVVGACIGAAVGGVAAGLMHVVPWMVAGAVAIMFGVLATGAFHEDGLADTADAMGGWTIEQRREILKDSRHGSYGVAALCGSIVVRVACVATLGPAAAFAGLVAAHALARASAVGVMVSATPPDVDGLGADYMRALSRRAALTGMAAGLAIAVLVTGWWAIPLAVGAGVGAATVAVVGGRALGGVTGDVLGAAEQVAECLVLVIASGLALRHSLWWC
jgi:adenosylcobinamide-GDP ribazoletransferase